MTRTLGRRDFLVGSAVLAGVAVGDGFKCVECASAAPIEVPVVDKSLDQDPRRLHPKSFPAPRHCQRRERAANPHFGGVSQRDSHPMGPVALARIPARR